ncbi:Clp protease N-terminal domain-containing protein [Phytohabitans kaempferiae]|uniref:Clp protease N-terminal domain-containing protein n=1 Tax=Phytohabitans kaempferiae TaxID=1620943 RepID=A0ABV6MCA3_9ACTN
MRGWCGWQGRSRSPGACRSSVPRTGRISGTCQVVGGLGQVGTSHLLLALLDSEDDNDAYRLVVDAGGELQDIQSRVEAASRRSTYLWGNWWSSAISWATFVAGQRWKAVRTTMLLRRGSYWFIGIRCVLLGA